MGELKITTLRPIAAVLGLGLVAGCTSGQTTTVPFTSVPLSANKAQLAVGVATFNDGTTGLNVVTTFRQKNGLSATLLNTPTITGPFTVPADATGSQSGPATTTFTTGECAKNVDDGTGHITGSAQSVVTANAACTTFGQAGLVLSYGIAPENSTTAQAPSFIQYGDFNGLGDLYGAPFYGDPCTESDCTGDSATDEDGNPLPGYSQAGYAAFRGGPPAFPNARLGTYPTGFLGFGLGFNTFALTPVAGTYNLSINVPSGNTAGATITAPSTTLTNVVGLPAFADDGTDFVEDGAGGGTATCTAPAGVTETIVELFDAETDSYYTQVVQGAGAVTATFADNLGGGAGTAGPTLNPGDGYEVECIGADYPLYEAGPTQSNSQTPVIAGANGQADIVFDFPFDSTYGAAEDTAKGRNAAHRHKQFHRRLVHPHAAVRV